jgi:hypothetical protein
MMFVSNKKYMLVVTKLRQACLRAIEAEDRVEELEKQLTDIANKALEHVRSNDEIED